MTISSNLREEKILEKKTFLGDLSAERKALFREVTKESPYAIPKKSPIIIDIIIL